MTTPINPSAPFLPPLYFEGRGTPRRIGDSDEGASLSRRAATVAAASADLPPEILSRVLGFADWGDLAKLACVQRSWSTVLVDAAGHSESATWDLAQSLLDGTRGLRKNPARALEIMRDLSNVEIDDSGDGGGPAEPAARDAAAPFFAPAMRKISEIYFAGNGVGSADPQRALAWLRAAFELGEDVDAAHELALVHEFGRDGVDVDVVAAAEWFERAAEAGHVEAMSELGLCYELGIGVEQDDEKALDWYTRAANLGHVTAKFSVGEAFEAARGVPQSDEEACLWYYRAASNGCEDSKVALRRLYDIARIVVPGVAGILNV